MNAEYIELLYACSRLGVIAVPLNTRLSTVEIDHVLADASPLGLIRHSSLPAPKARLSWQLVLDQEPLEVNPAIPTPATPFTTPKRSSLSSTQAAQRAGRRASW